MKTKLAFLSVAFLLAAPFAAAAQTPTPVPSSPVTAPAPPGPPAPHMHRFPMDLQTMRKFHDQASALRTKSRAQILDALSPAHRQYVATLIGQLAVSENPDPKAAAARIDAMLSSAERNNVLAADQSYRTQMRALITQMRTQMMSQLTTDERAHMTTGMSQMMARGQAESNGRPPRTPDAGRIILDTALGGFGPRMMFFGIPRGMNGFAPVPETVPPLPPLSPIPPAQAPPAMR
jgi:Spy/CpxP family protein refolding chaperone